MGSKFLGRYRLVNKKVLIIQKRSIGFWTVIPFIALSILDWIICFIFRKKPSTQEWWWEDWTEYNNILYQKDEELNLDAKRMKERIAERDAMEELINGEIKSLEKDEYATRGYSHPQYFDSSKVCPVGLRFVKPEQEWKKILNPRIYGKGKKTASGKYIGDKIKYDDGNSTTAYTLSDYAQYNVTMEDAAREGGANQLITYIESNNKGKNNKGNSGGGKNNNVPNPKNRKRQNGESAEGHEERLAALQANEDVSNWEFS